MIVAHLDCFSGISGNMLLGAVVDAGLPQAALEEELGKLDLPGWRLRIEPVRRRGLAATLVEVETEGTPPRRDLNDIRRLIAASALAEEVKRTAAAVFGRLAEAEAAAHGEAVERVHFHEVGAVDAIVDVVGAVAGLHRLGVARVTASPLPLGGGWVEFSHGRFPVPAPAVAELIRDVPVYGGPVESELVTPTGAAILTTLCQAYGPLPSMRVRSVGYGAGSRDLSHPNALRLFLGEQAEGTGDEALVLLETNIDDMNPELFEHVMDRLFEAGALDVFLTPIIMKKGRPATMVSALGEVGRRDELAAILFAETTTLGVRIQELTRRCLAREVVEVETRWGRVRVKVARSDGITTISPEYEDCRRLARESGVPLKEIYAEAGVRAREIAAKADG